MVKKRFLHRQRSAIHSKNFCHATITLCLFLW